jgi:hypothetical protein
MAGTYFDLLTAMAGTYFGGTYFGSQRVAGTYSGYFDVLMMAGTYFDGHLF